MLITALFFVAVSSYIVGLVGSSNNPVSGMTIITLLFASLLLLLFKMSGPRGIIGALGVAGIVCCAACTAGDISQDLKTGYLVGATPKFQQVAQMVGVFFSAFIIAPILIVLHRAYGIGTGEPGALVAPQASLFASLTKGIFMGKGLPVNMILIGVIIGILLIIIDELLKMRGTKFRAYIMPTAVGIYLPLVLSTPILIGGIINLIVKKVSIDKEGAIHRGTLFSSGLIAGEAVMGIIIAFLIVAGLRLPLKLMDSNFISLLIFVSLLYMLFVTAIKAKK
jgi:putative OPT family oligopeptide transporter